MVPVAIHLALNIFLCEIRSVKNLYYDIKLEKRVAIYHNIGEKDWTK